MAKIHQAALALLLPLIPAFAQQSITLNDGTQYQGRFVGGSPDTVTFEDVNGMKHRFAVRDIQTLNFNDSGAYNNSGNYPPPGNYSNDSSYPPSPQQQGVYRGTSNVPPPRSAGGYPGTSNVPPPQGSYNNGSYNPPQQTAGSYPRNPPPYTPNSYGGGSYATLAVNTQIAVRTSEAIHTTGGATGRTYASTIDQDVLDSNGNVVIPRGSNAVLVVRDMGNNQISLDLQSVSVNGQRYALNTQDVTRTGNANRGVGANRRTGEYAGGGAVLGTLLGAIAGGGRGAAIGAVAGAAAGLGTQVLTRGSEVQVPAETVLTFQLDQPVYLYQ